MIYEKNIQPPVRMFNKEPWQPKERNEYHADIDPGVSIRVHGVRYDWNGRHEFDQRFRVGDWLQTHIEGDVFEARITSIGAKTVSLDGGMRRGGRYAKRWNLWRFCNRVCSWLALPDQAVEV